MAAAASLSAPSDVIDALAAARENAVLCDLAAMGALRFTGQDAAAFLPAQLTNDVQGLAPGASSLTAWCSAKGRVLANGLLHRSGETEFLWLLSADLAPGVQK